MGRRPCQLLGQPFRHGRLSVLRLRSCGLQQCFNRKYDIHRAGAKTLEVERDVRESQRLEDAGKFNRHLGIERPGQFLASDFEANDIAVMADAKLPKTQLPERFFPLLNRLESFGGYRTSVLDARGQASGGRLVPDAQAREPRQFANLLLGQAGLEQRSSYTVLLGGPPAGAVVTLIVSVHAVRDGVVSTPRAKLFHHGE